MSTGLTGAYSASKARLLGLDEPAFPAAYRASTPIAVDHTLANHPLLALGAVADLADWLPRDSIICDTADQALLVPEGGPRRGREGGAGDGVLPLHWKRSCGT